MKRLFPLFFVTVFSLQTLQTGLIYLYNTLNKSYIADNLCKNTDFPELKCDGKCHLQSVLNISKKESSDMPAFPDFSEIKNPFLFCNEFENPFHISSGCFYIPDSLNVFFYLFSYRCSSIASLFRPPQLI
jgi:hypothetical protein